MRTRGLAILAVASLALAACGSAATPDTSGAPPAGVPPAASAPAVAAPRRPVAVSPTRSRCTGSATSRRSGILPRRRPFRSQGVNFQLMFDKLIEREWAADGSSWKPVPDLADSWEVSPDGLTWTFHLHPGVKWHDGQPFTANDVAFTVSRSLQHTLRNTQNAWAAVVGVKETPIQMGSRRV